jgi:hypothetical protein
VARTEPAAALPLAAGVAAAEGAYSTSGSTSSSAAAPNIWGFNRALEIQWDFNRALEIQSGFQLGARTCWWSTT